MYYFGEIPPKPDEKKKISEDGNLNLSFFNMSIIIS
jgi:hypothetical protein